MMEAMKAHMKREQNSKKENFAVLNQMAKKGEILFVGSSLMEQFPIQEILMNHDMHLCIYNRGIGGYTTEDMLEAMEEQIFALEPAKIFINIGTNDLAAPGYTLEKLIGNYRKILMQIKERLPKTRVITMAYYPVNEVDKVPDNEWGKHMYDVRNNANIKLANEGVCNLAKELGYEYIDVNDGLTDDRGMLKAEYTYEGLHMKGMAYEIVFQNMLKAGVL